MSKGETRDDDLESLRSKATHFAVVHQPINLAHAAMCHLDSKIEEDSITCQFGHCALHVLPKILLKYLQSQ